MARTSTQPQAAKQFPTRRRHLELRRRDKTVKFRAAFHDGWNDARHALIERTAGWDILDEPLADDFDTLDLFEIDDFDFGRTFDIDPMVLPCGCTGVCEFDGLYPDDEPLADWELALLNGTFDDYDLNDEGEPLDEFGDDFDAPEDDVVTYYDGYAKIGGAYVVDTGAGFGLDAVFGDGYLSGNCGFSVRTRP